MKQLQGSGFPLETFQETEDLSPENDMSRILAVAPLLLLQLLTPSRPDVQAPRAAPAWKNTTWLNADRPQTLESLKGKVILLNFWTFTCFNCTNTVPSLVDFDRRFRAQGLVVLGIHDPEFPPSGGEHDKANVQRALNSHGIEYPNALDNDHATWNLYGIRYWPSFVLIDRKGRIRYEGYGEFHVGDKGYQQWDARIQELLAEQVASVEVRIVPTGATVVIRAVAAPGTRINARLAPQLELATGRSERLRNSKITADSAYFTAPPELTLPREIPLAGALVRVSVCDSGAAVCRVLVVPL